MTDLVTRHDADDASADPAPNADSADTPTPVPNHGTPETAVYEWAPIEPEPKKRHLLLWIGIPAVIAVVSLVVASLLLIAPGTAVAGVGIGGMTQGAAAEAIAQRLAQTTVELTGAGRGVTLTAAELGATVDADTLAKEAFADHPAWKLGDWFAATSDAPVTLDADTANAALRKAVPALYVDPTNAVVAFDAASTNYVVTPAVAGQGVDLDAVRAKLQDAFDAGILSTSMDPAVIPVAAPGATPAAQQTADGLNAMLGAVGFYVGDERTVPVDRAVAASWLTVTTAADGAISVHADPAQIQAVVDTLPAAINRAPVNAAVITDTEGQALSTTTDGVDGREVGDVSGAANAFAAQLSQMNGVYPVPVDTTPFSTVSLARSVVVDLGDQRAYLYENGAVVASYLISSGRPGYETHTGHFRINSHLTSQNMGNPDTDQPPYYYTRDVPWVMYFNGDQALHGTYWHNNFGHVMSHGCVNMPVDAAHYLFTWAPNGTEVTVQN